MIAIADIKRTFDDPAILNIFADCMYMPTPEKLRLRAAEYMGNDSMRLFGAYDGGKIAGVIAVEARQTGPAEIKGIAVDSNFRKRGIGGALIRRVCETLCVAELTAETDDDAVGFYERCGFVSEKFQKRAGNEEYTRYRCVLRSSLISKD